MKKTIGIIGCGNMGRAIAEKIKTDFPVLVFDKFIEKTGNVSGVQAVSGIGQLCSGAQAIILAVKPQDFDDMLDELKGKINNKLIITIAAGIPTFLIEKSLGAVAVVRVMPNIAARIGKSTSCVSKGKYAGIEELDLVQNIFDLLGQTIVIEEALMNAATAVSGSGPGFFYYLLQSKKINPTEFDVVKRFALEEFSVQLTRAALALGFNMGQAEFLAVNTVEGSLGMLNQEGVSLEELIKQITSKGGTTEAGIEALGKGLSLEEAVNAAKMRAEMLARR
ncbi:MAG: pyrroline-5-carboxylate reductase [Candidatus Omnitrophica bacterium]|nr:pyrroline-5-carboxylate reductase [Candidatus Omnitrophota bacterium]